MYKNVSEEKLLKQINLSDLTAAAYLKDPKGRRQHMFGLFTPSRNYQFQAASDAEARTWVELIRTEARIDEEEESLIFGSPPAVHNPFASKKVLDISDTSPHRQDHDRLGSSSPEPLDTPLPPTTARNGIRIPGAHQLSAQELDYSGQDHGSYSDFSDTALYGTSNASIPQTSLQAASANTNTSASLVLRPNAPRNPSQVNAANTEAVAKNNSVSASAGNADGTKLDEERVIWQGYLLCLKSKGGVRQWKRLWVVLRPKHMAFYKTDEVCPHVLIPLTSVSSLLTPFLQEYSAHLLIPFTSILSAIEIDPISRSKSHCMQIIAEDRNYRFCAPSEEALARCLGALKSQLAKRKDREKKRTGV